MSQSSLSSSAGSSGFFPTTLLSFQKKVISEFIEDDGLLIMAKGLGIEQILIQILRCYCDPTQLVLILNYTPEEEQLIKQLLIQSGLIKLENVPKSITSTSFTDRKGLYDQGGCLFITSRILIVDLLNEKVPIENVSGIILLNAHELKEKSTEAFILRYFRLRNQQAFVKGFSENPEEFTKGFAKLEDVMKLLFVNKLFLWPRYHLEVIRSFEKKTPIVKEEKVPLTPKMKLIENGIIEIISSTLEQLKKNNRSLDLSDFTLENCYFKSFNRIVKNQLKPIWNKIGKVSKQLIEDLKTMRTLLFYLLNYDCVTFYDYLEALRVSDGKNGIPKSNWLLTETASDIFLHAKERIYKIETAKVSSPLKKQKTLTQIADNREVDTTVSVDRLEFVLEENPKWNRLDKILNNIYEKIQRKPTQPFLNNGKVLIVASNDKTCLQLKYYLELGGKGILTKLVNKLIGPQIRRQQKRIEKEKKEKLGDDKDKTKRKRKDKKKKEHEVEMDLLTQHFIQVEEEEGEQLEEVKERKEGEEIEPAVVVLEDKKKEEEDIITHPIDFFEIINSDAVEEREMQVMIHSVYDTITLLDEYQPSYIIVYENDLSFIRRIEMYQCKYPFIPLEVYILSYDKESVECKQYQTIVNREKEAFKQLILSNSRLAIPSIETLISEIHLQERMKRQEINKYYQVNNIPKGLESTRKAGGNMILSNNINNGATSEFDFSDKPKVIIDVREFRSSLPSLLNLHGFKIIPLQISVGDYVVSKYCCIERKSTSDLWQSLNSGRLYTQVENMLKYYKHTFLLIQFEDDEAFSLPDPFGFYKEDSRIEDRSIVTKLVLTIVHFPKLKLAYSRSPTVTSKYFYMMKNQVLQYNDYDLEEKDEDKEPDIIQAQSLGTSEHREENEASNQAIEFLSRMPGVTIDNVNKIVNSVSNLYELAQLSLEQLTVIMGSEQNARKLYDFLNESIEIE
ncbi:hypothetical protein ABK040_014323 [Willaertia magna]